MKVKKEDIQINEIKVIQENQESGQFFCMNCQSPKLQLLRVKDRTEQAEILELICQDCGLIQFYNISLNPEV